MIKAGLGLTGQAEPGECKVHQANESVKQKIKGFVVDGISGETKIVKKKTKKKGARKRQSWVEAEGSKKSRKLVKIKTIV